MTDKTTLERIREPAIPTTWEARESPIWTTRKSARVWSGAVLDLLCDEDLPDA